MARRRIATCLAIVVMLAMLAAPARPAIGTGSAPRYESSFLKLNRMDLIRGDERGLRPTYPITRAEFATVVIRMLGQEDPALAVGRVPTPFADVAADHWATGYVNVAYSLGIVRGVTATTFEPERLISHAEAAAMLIRAIGKDHAVSGAWPVGYLIVADDLGMLIDTDLSPERPISRAEVARYIDNCLEIPFDIRTAAGWVTVPGKTVLARLGFMQRSGRLTDADVANGTITLDDTQYQLSTGAAFYGGDLAALRGHSAQILGNTVTGQVVYVGAIDLRTR